MKVRVRINNDAIPEWGNVTDSLSEAIPGAEVLEINGLNTEALIEMPGTEENAWVALRHTSVVEDWEFV